MENGGKMFYGIKEVADLLGVTAPTLRFYEKEFPTLQPKKNRAGERTYTQADIDHLRDILELVKQKGLTLPGAREELKNREIRRRENARYIARLQEVKAFLEKLRAGLEANQST